MPPPLPLPLPLLTGVVPAVVAPFADVAVAPVACGSCAVGAETLRCITLADVICGCCGGCDALNDDWVEFGVAFEDDDARFADALSDELCDDDGDALLFVIAVALSL